MNHHIKNSDAQKRASKVLADLKAWNKNISVTNRDQKFRKMAVAPLVFFRGTNHLFWSDFGNDDRLTQFGSSETKTWLQGDLHVYNFGSYDNSKGEIIYELNDFDEAVYTDYQYDLWRLAVSIILVARQNGDLSDQQQAKVIDSLTQTYFAQMKAYLKEKKPGREYATRQTTFGKLQKFLTSVENHYSRAGMLDHWAHRKEGSRYFDLGRSKLATVTDNEHQMLLSGLKTYRQTLRKKLAILYPTSRMQMISHGVDSC